MLSNVYSKNYSSWFYLISGIFLSLLRYSEILRAPIAKIYCFFYYFLVKVSIWFFNESSALTQSGIMLYTYLPNTTGSSYGFGPLILPG